MPEIQMPKLSDTMTEGALIAWKKKKGDQVSAGEVLAEIKTDKATMEWEAPEDGTLTEIYVQEGGKVNVGDKIAFVRGQGGGEHRNRKRRHRIKRLQAAEEKKPASFETEKPAPAQAAKKETAPPKQQGVGAAVSAARAETTQQKPQAREQNRKNPA